METNLKKLLGLTGAMASVVTMVHAAPNDNAMNQNSPRSADDGKYRVITPEAGPRVSNGADVFITADFIYWTARLDGLDYSRTGQRDLTDVLNGTPTTTNNSTSVQSKGSTNTVGTKFSPGFKVGLGLNFNHDGWDTFLEYTWFQTSQAVTSAVAADTIVAAGLTATSDAAFDVTDIGGTFTNVSAKSSLHFNNFDWELGRNYFVSQYLTMRPHAGLKGGWYRQYYRTNQSGLLENNQGTVATDLGVTSLAELGVIRSRQHQNYWWVGIRSGLDSAFHFTRNWSMFGNMAASLNWGRFDNSRKDTVQLGATATAEKETFTTVWTQNEFHTVKGVLESQIGFRYDYWWSDDDYHFGIDAAWEMQLWINQNQFVKLNNGGAAGAGDLSFQGFTLHLRLDF